MSLDTARRSHSQSASRLASCAGVSAKRQLPCLECQMLYGSRHSVRYTIAFCERRITHLPSHDPPQTWLLMRKTNFASSESRSIICSIFISFDNFQPRVKGFPLTNPTIEYISFQVSHHNDCKSNQHVGSMPLDDDLVCRIQLGTSTSWWSFPATTKRLSATRHVRRQRRPLQQYGERSRQQSST